MRSLIGEFIFGLGISIMAGAFVLLWQYMSEIVVSMKWLYVGILIIVGIILIWIGAVRINKFETQNTFCTREYPAPTRDYTKKCLLIPFILGFLAFLIKFIISSEPNFYSLSALLLGILILFVLADKVEYFKFSNKELTIKMVGEKIEEDSINDENLKLKYGLKTEEVKVKWLTTKINF